MAEMALTAVKVATDRTENLESKDRRDHKVRMDQQDRQALQGQVDQGRVMGKEF
jgi:hypothetical protein